MKKSRVRNLLLPVGLAVLAAVLIGVYVVSYRDSVNNGADLVKVYVAAKRHPRRHRRLGHRLGRLPDDARPCLGARSSPVRS